MRLPSTLAIAATTIAFSSLAQGQGAAETSDEAMRYQQAGQIVRHLAKSTACMTAHNNLAEKSFSVQEMLQSREDGIIYRWGSEKDANTPTCGGLAVTTDGSVRGLYAQGLFLNNYGTIKTKMNQLFKSPAMKSALKASGGDYDAALRQPEQQERLSELTRAFAAGMTSAPCELNFTTFDPRQVMPAGGIPYNAGSAMKKTSLQLAQF